MMIAGAMCTPTLAIAQDDDWEFAADPARNLTVAAVRYSDGKSIVAQCAGKTLKLAIVGLPGTTERSRRFDATRADGATDTQVWQVGESGALTSGVAGRDVRFLRMGGTLRLRSSAGQPAPVSVTFDLPTTFASLDRVLVACGYPVVDDRDRIPRTDPGLRTLYQIEHADEIERLNRERPSQNRSGGGRRAQPPPPPGGRVESSIEVSCIVRGGAYQDCRVDHIAQGSTSEAANTARGMNGDRIDPAAAAANEGRVAYVGLVTTVEYIGRRSD